MRGLVPVVVDTDDPEDDPSRLLAPPHVVKALVRVRVAALDVQQVAVGIRTFKGEEFRAVRVQIVHVQRIVVEGVGRRGEVDEVCPVQLVRHLLVGDLHDVGGQVLHLKAEPRAHRPVG